MARWAPTSISYHNMETAFAYAATKYGGGQLPLGDPFEPIPELVARAEAWAVKQWQHEQTWVPPPPDPTKRTRR